MAQSNHSAEDAVKNCQRQKDRETARTAAIRQTRAAYAAGRGKRSI